MLAKQPALVGGALTSPAKLGFAAYVLFVYWNKLNRPSACEFWLIVFLFFAAQVVHDDFLRKLLNNYADKICPPLDKKAGSQ